MESCEIVVVGAGYAGLTAARHLIAAGKEVIVLEARDRVGGRVYTQQLSENFYVDLGGQWIGPTQDKIYALCKELGVGTFGTYNQGKNIISLRKKVKTYRGLIPKIDIPSLLNIDFTIKKLEKLAKQVDLETPWLVDQAEKWDSQTLATFLDREVKFSNARTVIDAGMETIYATSSAEISLLNALFYIHSGGSLNALLSIDQGAQQDRIQGGAQLPAERLADQFRDRIRFNAPVRQITQDESGVQVQYDGGQIQAKKVIVAIPPTLAAKIDYHPSLPPTRVQLTQRMPMGTVIKCYAIYDRPWWRDLGYSGQIVADPNLPFQTTFDNSPSDGSKGVLMAFCLANRARPLLNLSMEERGKIILEGLVHCFGPAAAKVEQYLDHSWAAEEWSGGCYVGLRSPGAWVGYGNALVEPCGHIHWAGTETATVWNGYIEGAIRSGEDAAVAVLSRGASHRFSHE